MNEVVIRFARGDAANPLPDMEQCDVFGPFGSSEAAVAWRDAQNQAGHFYIIRPMLRVGQTVGMAGSLRMTSAAKAAMGGSAIEPRTQLESEVLCPLCGCTQRPFKRPNGQLDCSLCEGVVSPPQDSKG